MRKTLLGVGFLSLALVGALFAGAGIVRAASPFPASDNDTNKTNGWGYVEQTDIGPGTTTLEFVSTRNFYSCFEYRTDGDESQKTSDTNYNTDITDGLYPYTCVKNSTESVDFDADEYVEVRLTFGAESDERFDWTRFDVEPKPEEDTTPCGDACKPWTPPKSIPTAPQCHDMAPALGIANVNVVRTSDTTALVQWSLHSGDQTHIIFGEAGTGWHHAALNVGTSGEAVINELIPGRTYDWAVIPMNGCAAAGLSPTVHGI